MRAAGMTAAYFLTAFISPLVQPVSFTSLGLMLVTGTGLYYAYKQIKDNKIQSKQLLRFIPPAYHTIRLSALGPLHSLYIPILMR